jgi:hypothetical protein
MDCNSDEWCSNQFEKYMGQYTSKTIKECYTIYTRPGRGGKKWNKEEQKIMEKIDEISGRGSNPYTFRLMK